MGSPRDDTGFERPQTAFGENIAGHVEAIVRAAEREALAAERAIANRRRDAEDEVQRYLAAARLQVDAEAAARAARLETLSTAARRLADELSDAADALNRELQRGDDELHAAVPRTPWPRRETAPPASPAPAQPHGASPPASPAPAQPHGAPPRPAPAPEPPTPAAARDEPAPHEPIAAAGPATAGPQPTWTRAAEPHQVVANGTAGPVVAPVADPEARTAAETSPPRPAPNGEVPNAARLVAIEMAVGGAARADVETHLRTRFAVADPSPLLDDVFGAESHAGSTLAWGEP